MIKNVLLLISTVLLISSCNSLGKKWPNAQNVLVEENITYANGLGYDNRSQSSFALPQKLDIYYPDDASFNRPVFMFIHGGGFKGGSKNMSLIKEMAYYYASRGWVFVSIDYRTVGDLGDISDMSSESAATYYTGIAPADWIELTQREAGSKMEFQTGIAMYAAQRDAKAALRWIVANSNTYNIDTDFITVGGASAGAITAITLGISNQEDFRDEISIAEDPTLTTTNLDQTYDVRCLVDFWGTNMKLELFESVYGLNRHDGNDPELFIAHGTEDQNAATPFSEATELKGIYDSLGIYNELVPLEGERHGAWKARVNGESLFDLSYNFLAEKLKLTVE